MERPHPLLLIILDGFGISLEREGNPVAHATIPTLDMIERNFPFTTLQASGTAVGLPWGEPGNSEVGHLTMGAGRVIYHHLPRIVSSIYDGSFFTNDAFLKAIAHVKKNHSSLHLAGLVSSGSVHSYIDHLYALLTLTKNEGVERVYLHVFSDGKDALPKEGAHFLGIFEDRIKKEWPQVRLASIIGRSFAMDRDEKWDRIQKTYALLTKGVGEKIRSIASHLSNSYAGGITDEFIEPAVFVGEDETPIGTIKDQDALIFFNFREDSMRELTHAFVDPEFRHFERISPKPLFVVTMTEYEKGLRVVPAFPALLVEWPLARIIGEAGLSHLHIAETEKYAHVTYFFNGGREDPFLGEKRVLIPSIHTIRFEEIPEMRAREITDEILGSFDTYDVIIANFANADMVGHTGSFQAAVRAMEVLDGSLGKLVEAVLMSDGVMVVTGDHGNIELKRHAISGEKLTEHSLDPVPLYLVGKSFKRLRSLSDEEVKKQKSEVGGILIDVAPTILALLGIQKPEEMTGKNLLPTLLR